MVVGAAIQSGPRTRSIAVINVPKISDVYKKREAMEDAIEAKGEALEQQRLAKQQEIQKLTQALDTQFVQGTPDYATRRADIILKTEH